MQFDRKNFFIKCFWTIWGKGIMISLIFLSNRNLGSKTISIWQKKTFNKKFVKLKFKFCLLWSWKIASMAPRHQQKSLNLHTQQDCLVDLGNQWFPAPLTASFWCQWWWDGQQNRPWWFDDFFQLHLTSTIFFSLKTHFFSSLTFSQHRFVSFYCGFNLRNFTIFPFD